MKPTPAKKLLASATLIIASILYVIYLNLGNSQEFAVTNPSSAKTGTDPASTSASNPVQRVVNTVRHLADSEEDDAPVRLTAPTPTPTPTATPTPAPAASASGLYTDGSYTGTAADAYYGMVQVRASVSGGKLTDVAFLQFPNDRSTSREISAQATPLLKNEAIQIQSANVDIISGATDTSLAFRQSLASALAQAKR